MWKSESALLIYLAVVVCATVAARPVVAHHLAAPQPGITSRFVPCCRPESLGALPVRLAAEVAIE
jgi:hypothetical protein